MASIKKIAPREAAYLACLNFEKEGRYIADFLNDWFQKYHPTPQDFRLAQEIAYGTCRMRLALEYHAECLSNKKLNLKRKERILLFTALYQHYYLDKIPLYALTNESIKIAKKYCHSHFIKFLNAVLRILSSDNHTLPQDNSIQSLSIRYSYPEYYVKTLCEEQKTDQVIQILEAGNARPVLMARKREETSLFPEMVTFNGSELNEFFSTEKYYIQNSTPALLMKFLGEGIVNPKKILDLCAAPGGKLIACHDLFSGADLYANDVSSSKIKILEENLHKYKIMAALTSGRGEDYPTTDFFDLIILDVPCSNTGVLNKRPEARWRLSKDHVNELIDCQFKLLQHAKKLISNKGQIWYMTCSILQDENEKLIEKATKELGLSIKKQMKILPDLEGADGGYGVALAIGGQ